LLADRLDRPQFMQLAIGLGVATATARTMAGVESTDARQVAHRRPNILLILADDLGIMGSEIRTPNIDSIGRKGRHALPALQALRPRRRDFRRHC
jgi:hypothetical protein